MTDRSNSIQINVRRTDELLSQLSAYPTRSTMSRKPMSGSHSRNNMAELDDLRQSIDSLDLGRSPKSDYSSLKAKLDFSEDSQRNKPWTSPAKARFDPQPPAPIMQQRRPSQNETQIQLPIDSLLFEKLNESMEAQESKLAEWDRVLKQSSNLQNDFGGDNNDDIEHIQESGNNLIDLQITTLEDLSHDTAPHAFNDNKTIHKISRMLNERQLRLESDKINFDSKLSSATTKRERYEKELEELTKRLHEARTDESELNTNLHEITIELSSVNDQLSITNSMKNRINTNLNKMNGVEKQLIDAIHSLKTQLGEQWKAFAAQWRTWEPRDIAVWINHHGLQQQYDTRTLVQNMSEQLRIQSGADLMKLSKGDWAQLGISNARDRRYLRNEFGILSAPPSVADHFKCPLTKQLMRDPVIAADGYTYEREALHDWFQNNKKKWNNIQCVVSPLTGDILTTDMAFANHQLFKEIQDYRKANNIH